MSFQIKYIIKNKLKNMKKMIMEVAKRLLRLDRPIRYPRLLDLEWFKNQTILNSGAPLYENPKKSYDEYLLEYKRYEREQKLNDLDI